MDKKIKLRSLFIGGLFTLFFVGLFFRLYTIQVVEASELMGKAMNVWQDSEELQPTRGSILDRSGNVLAQDGVAYTIAVNPSMIHNQGKAKEVTDKLAPILGMTSGEKYKELYAHVTAKNKEGKYLYHREIRIEGWKVDKEVRDQVVDSFGGDEGKMMAQGVMAAETTKRYYRGNEMAAQLLGYVDKDGNPKSGIEYRYHQYMKGEAGSIQSMSDGSGYNLPNSEVEYTPVVDGYDIELTIDESIQMFMEQAMRSAYEQYKPKEMIALAVNPKTLEILGLVNMPNYDPNRYWEADTASMNNAAAMSVYEPGSTFKIVTLAAAVEEGLFDPNDTYLSGQIKVPGTTIHDHDRRGWGEITYLQGLKRSSNVAFVKMGYEMLGKEKLVRYIKDFGFGEPTGVDLPGESTGDVSLRWDSDYAVATFGQGVTVTALQQIAAVSAIANGGKLMKPYLLKSVIDPETGKIVEAFGPQVVRQVISEQTAKEVSGYLEQVVSDQEIGTGRKAFLEGYTIAGKTGTAQLVVDGKYAEDKWVASFIGFAPVEDPQIALIVIAAQPEIVDYREAGNVVAPVFKEIMGKSLHYFGIASKGPEGGVVTINSGEEQVPDVTDKTLVGAENEAIRHSIQLEILGGGQKVVEQFPEAGSVVGPGQKLYVLTEPAEQVELPDLTGKSKRDVIQLCSLLDVHCTFDGEGYVSSYTEESAEGARLLTAQLAPLGQEVIDETTDDNEETEVEGTEGAQSG